MSNASNIMRAAISEGSMPIAKLEDVRADLVWLRDEFERYAIGSGHERKLLNDTCACLCACIALEP